MTHGNLIDRRRHRGPLRILYMNFSDFLKRFLGLGSPRR